MSEQNHVHTFKRTLVPSHDAARAHNLTCKMPPGFIWRPTVLLVHVLFHQLSVLSIES